MAFPVILLDSAAGSDTAASGAGPGTALTGSAGVSTGTTVVLDGSPNLAGVATDGSHALWFNDTTAGNRNFAKITGTANSGTPTAQVTVAETLATTTKAWAIGGKRQTISGASSLRLVTNNSASGDAMPGWTIRMNNSGFTDSFNGGVFRALRDGSSTGRITFEGLAGLATRPLLTCLDDVTTFLRVSAAFWDLQNFNVTNSSGTLTSNYGIYYDGNGVLCGRIENIRIGMSSGQGFAYGCLVNGGMVCRNIEASYNSVGMYCNQGNASYLGCYVHDNTSDGFYAVSDLYSLISSVFARNGGKGINDQSGASRSTILDCVIDSNTSDGINSNSTDGTYRVISNNIISNNGGYGVKFNGNMDAATSMLILAEGNDFYNNTSGITDSSPSPFVNNQTVNPQFVSASTGDFTPQNTTLKGAAAPATLGIATNYQWIGAIQALVVVLADLSWLPRAQWLRNYIPTWIRVP